MLLRNLKLVLCFLVFSVMSIHAQVVDLGCQDHNDAFIGLDRKDWNNGSTSSHSEGMFLNFELPDEEDCKKIQDVEITIDAFVVDDSGLDVLCLTPLYYINIYSGCGDFDPASCPTSNLVDEPFGPTLNSQTLTYDCDDFDFQFGDILGIDVVPAIGNVGCPNGQSAISSGDIILEYEICVEVTLVDLDIDIPLDLGDDLFVCPGETVEIDAGAGYDEYDWSPNGETTQTITAGGGVYEVTVTDSKGCTATDMIEVEESDVSVSILADDIEICEGETIELEADTNQSDIEWSTGEDTPTIEVSAGDYQVTVTDGQGCTSEDMITITENPLPTVSIAPDDTDVCEGETTTLNATPGFDEYEWDNGMDTESITVGAGDYSVTITDENGCMAEAMITIGENPLPIVDIDADPETLCGDDMTTLSATPGFFNYLWSNGMFGPDIDVEAGTYEVTVIDVNGCTGVNSIEITNVDPPMAGSDASIDVCNDGSLFDIAAELGTFDSDGNWDDVDNSGVDLNDDDENVSFEDVDPGVYQFTYTVDGLVPCPDDQATITVTVFDQLNAGDDNDLVACQGEEVDLEDLLGTFDNGGDWDDVDNSGVDLSDPSAVVFDNVDEGTYDFEYTVESEAPCNDDVAIITITIEPESNAGDDNEISVCVGSEIDLNTALSNDAQNGGSFIDTDGSGALSGDFFDTDGLEGQTFDFTYQVGDPQSNCGQDEATITVSVVTQVSAGSDSPNNEICEGVVIDLYDLLSDADLGGEFQDEDGDEVSNIFDAGSAGQGSYTFTYVVGDNLVCPADEAEIDIQVIPQPSFSIQLSENSICDSNCLDLILDFVGTPEFNYSVSIVDTANMNSDRFDFVANTNQAIITVCDFNLDPSVSNDTLFMGSGMGAWGLTLSSFTDENCLVNLDPQVGDTLFFNSYDPEFSVIDTTLCFGDSIVVDGITYNESNPFFIDTLSSFNGCDSIVEIRLDFYDQAYNLIDDQLCSGSSIFVNGVIYDEAMPTGQEIIMNGSVNGCDSLIDISLSFVDGFDISVDSTLCSGDSLFVANQWIFSDTLFLEQLMSVEGCDSMVTYTIVVEDESSFLLEQSLCSGEFIVVNGETYDEDNPMGVENLMGQAVNGCDSIVTIDLEFFDVYDISQDITICEGDSIFLDGAWQFNAGTIVENLMSIDGCDSTITTMLMVESCDLDFNLVGSSVSCFGGDDGKILVQNTNGLAPIMIFWGGENNGPNGMVDITDPNIEYCIENLIADSYEVGILDAQGNIYSEVIVVDTPEELVVALISVVGTSCPGEDDGMAEIEVTGGSPDYDLFLNGNPISDSMISDLSPGDYIIQAQDSNGCLSNELMIGISDQEPLVVEYEFADPGCQTTMDGFITLNQISGGVGLVTVFIDGVQVFVGDTLNSLTGGNYTIMLNDANGCILEEEVVLIEPAEVDLVDYPSFFQIDQGETITIQGQAFEDMLMYTWTDELGVLSCTDCDSPVFMGSNSTTLDLIVSNMDGCEEFVSISIQVDIPEEELVLPNIFSPDNDGVNDEFSILFPSYLQDAQVEFRVYDRWGNEMFLETAVAQEMNSWEGRYNGQALNSGVYSYILIIQPTVGESILRKGSITLVK